MSGLIPQRFIDELLDRIDLAELIGSRITLKKAGGNYKACCPFHDERTPSFNVRPDKGFYHCFGCGAHGDAIAFLREFDNLGFTEAVEELAGRLGMEVPYDEAAKEEMRQVRTLTGALDQASAFYRRSIREHPNAAVARDYLAHRGVDAETAERFQLGFAPPEGDALVRHVDQQTREALLRVKTISDRYGKPRDLFRNRLMFPIRNTRGRTVAFGGRTLGDDKAKYINSPESEVYHKSREIYGLYEAQQASRRIQRLLVVEGYMDVVALSQHGITYTVAASGTATNQESLQALLRQARHLIFSFDGDQAGHRAADKALENTLELLQDGIHIQFLMLPEDEDPDTLVRREGPEAFSRRIDEATPLSRLLFERQSEGLDLTLPEHRGEMRARVEPLLRRMPHSTLRDSMWQEMLRLTGRPAWQKRDKQGSQRTAAQPARNQPRIQFDRDTLLCAWLYEDPSRANEVLEATEGAADFEHSRAFARWMNERTLSNRDEVLLALARDPVSQSRFEGLFDRMEHFPDGESLVTDGRRILTKIREQHEQKELNSLLANKKPSELSEEERTRLQQLMARRNTPTSDRTH